MGNNEAYSIFQHTVIAIYNRGVLTLDLLDEIAKEYAGSDIDSGGDTGRLAKDGKDLEAICISTVDPSWIPVKDADESAYYDPDKWEREERYEKWCDITSKRWRWG